MRVVVFSGTTEGRVFSKQLAALGAEVLVSAGLSRVATYSLESALFCVSRRRS